MEDLHSELIPVVFTPDESFIIPTCIAIMSMLNSKKKSTNYYFYIIVGKHVNECHLQVFKRIKNIMPEFVYRIIRIDSSLFDDAPIVSSEHVTNSTYYRLFLANLISIDKCMYHDGDILVCDDLESFYEEDIADNYIAGTKTIVQHQGRPEDIKTMKQIGIKSMDQFILAGDLIINLKKIREDNVTEKFMIEIPKNHPHEDMSILNLCCYDHIFFFPLRWCVLNRWLNNKKIYNYSNQIHTKDEIEIALSNPAIIHFAGSEVKPWVNTRVEGGKAWWEYAKLLLSESEFINWRREAEEKTKRRDWKSFINELNKSNEYLIWGYSNTSRELADDLRKQGFTILEFIDNDLSKQGLAYKEIQVISPQDINISHTNIIIANQRKKREIACQILSLIEDNNDVHIINYYHKAEIYYLSLSKEYLLCEYKDLVLRKYGFDVENMSYEDIKVLDSEKIYKAFSFERFL